MSRWRSRRSFAARVRAAVRRPLHHQRDPGDARRRAAGRRARRSIRCASIDSESIEVGQLIFEGLVRWKPGTTDLEPGLAISWTVSRRRPALDVPAAATACGSTTARILDADAVVFSFERLLDPSHPNYRRADGDYWRGAAQGRREGDARSIRTPSRSASRGRTRRCSATSRCSRSCRRRRSRAGATSSRRTRSAAGRSRSSRGTVGEQVVRAPLRRLLGQRHAGLERIVFQVVVDARQRLIDLESRLGRSRDRRSSPTSSRSSSSTPTSSLHHTPGNDVSYLAFNTMHPPFDDVRVRRAANLAINKEPIVKLAYQGRATARRWRRCRRRSGAITRRARTTATIRRRRRSCSRRPPPTARFDPTACYKLYAPTTPRPYLSQPERVARFLASGARAGRHQDRARAAAVRESIARRSKRGEHDLALFGWIGDTGDPDNFLYVLFDSDNAIVGEAQNVAFYRDPEVDKLLVDAQGTLDEETRAVLYATGPGADLRTGAVGADRA